MAANAHNQIIKRANEQGYFPTPKQAKEISLVSAEEYGARFNGSPPRGQVVDSVFQECTDTAIRRVMEGKAMVREMVEGIAGPEMIAKVVAVIEGAAGKRLRVRMEEF
jgi:hypothetical protein